MRVLITGASGFLGAHLMPLMKQHEVLSLTHRRNEAQLSSGVRQLVGDLTREGGWQREVEEFGPECCIHLAWHGLPDYSLACCRVNLDANLRLLEVLIRARIKRVVVAGSCWEYGRVLGPVNENMSPIDCSMFAATKHGVRMMLESVAREVGFEYRWARIFFVYGPGQRRTSLIPYLHAQYTIEKQPVLRNAHAVEDFVYIEDVVRGLRCLTESDGPSGIFNIGSGQPTAVSSIANMVADHFEQPASFSVSDGCDGFWADASRTYKVFGWRAAVGITEGVAQSLKILDGAS